MDSATASLLFAADTTSTSTSSSKTSPQPFDVATTSTSPPNPSLHLSHAGKKQKKQPLIAVIPGRPIPPNPNHQYVRDVVPAYDTDDASTDDNSTVYDSTDDADDADSNIDEGSLDGNVGDAANIEIDLEQADDNNNANMGNGLMSANAAQHLDVIDVDGGASDAEIETDINTDMDVEDNGSVSTVSGFAISTQHAQQFLHAERLRQMSLRRERCQNCDCHQSIGVGSNSAMASTRNLSSEESKDEMTEKILLNIEHTIGRFELDEFLDYLHRAKAKVVERYELNEILVFGFISSRDENPVSSLTPMTATCCYLPSYEKKLTPLQIDFINLVCNVKYTVSRRKLNSDLSHAYRGPAHRIFFNNLVTRSYASNIVEASIDELMLVELTELRVNQSTSKAYNQHRDQIDVNALHRAMDFSTVLTLCAICDKCNELSELSASCPISLPQLTLPNNDSGFSSPLPPWQRSSSSSLSGSSATALPSPR